MKKRQSPSIKQQRQRMLTRSPKAVINQAWKTWETKYYAFAVW